MKIYKAALLGLSISLSLTCIANAGVKDWMRDKKERLTGQHTAEQVASPTELPPVEVHEQQQKAQRVDGKRLTADAAKGCAAGAVMSLLSGGLDLRACAAAAVGAGVQSVQQQLAQARQVEEAAKRAGMKAKVETEQHTDRAGRQQEAMKSIEIEYEASDLLAMDAKTVETMEKLSNLFKGSKGQLDIRIEGTNPACLALLTELDKRGALDRHLVDNQCGRSASHKLVITSLTKGGK
ncbi:TPA: hypothetical protein ACKP1A_000592 [Stenotrophomonas maltophilia]